MATSRADPSKTAVAAVHVVADLVDHGGAIAASTRTFVLWWGNPAAFSSDARVAMETLLNNLSGTRYLGIADQYMRGGRAVTSFAGSLIDQGEPPATPTGFDVDDAACRALDASRIGPGQADVVFVITSNFPREQWGSWCNWHGSAVCDGQTVLVVYSPNPAGTSCEARADPCGTGYTAETLSLVTGAAHEIMEVITNPFGDAWHFEGREIADKCGAVACVDLGDGTIMELQDLYSNEVHGCTAG